MSSTLADWPPPQIDPTITPDTIAAAMVGCDQRIDGAAGRWRRRWAVVLAGVIVSGSLLLDRGGLFAVVALFVLVVPFEKLFPRHRGQPLRRPAVGTDVAYALATPLLQVAGAAAAVVIGVLSLAWVPGLLLRPVVALVPAALLPWIAAALFDLAIYWAHRWAHEVPMLWRFHSVHHSTEHLDWVSGFRGHPFDGVIIAPPIVFLLAAGFGARLAGVLAVVQIVTGIFLHANVNWRWRALHRVVITPEFHHWHHADEPDARNSNYSVFLPLWDIVFGTYFMPTDRRPEVYGIAQPMPVGMLAQLRHPLHGAPSPVDVVRHPVRSTRAARRVVAGLARDIRRSTFRTR